MPVQSANVIPVRPVVYHLLLSDRNGLFTGDLPPVTDEKDAFQIAMSRETRDEIEERDAVCVVIEKHNLRTGTTRMIGTVSDDETAIPEWASNVNRSNRKRFNPRYDQTSESISAML